MVVALILAVAVPLLIVIPVGCVMYEDRADRRDREAWSRVPGSTR